MTKDRFWTYKGHDIVVDCDGLLTITGPRVNLPDYGIVRKPLTTAKTIIDAATA